MGRESYITNSVYIIARNTKQVYSIGLSDHYGESHADDTDEKDDDLSYNLSQVMGLIGYTPDYYSVHYAEAYTCDCAALLGRYNLPQTYATGKAARISKAWLSDENRVLNMIFTNDDRTYKYVNYMPELGNEFEAQMYVAVYNDGESFMQIRNEMSYTTLTAELENDPLEDDETKEDRDALIMETDETIVCRKVINGETVYFLRDENR